MCSTLAGSSGEAILKQSRSVPVFVTLDATGDDPECRHNGADNGYLFELAGDSA